MPFAYELEIGATPDEVWRALTEPELTQRWYHRASVTADWRAGGAVSYRWADGTELESGVVLEAEPGRRLVLQTSFVWDDSVRAEPAHSARWDLEAAGPGTRVRVTFEVPEAAAHAHHLIGEEGGYLLRGLRLAVDASEQALIARHDSIGEVEIRDVTPDLVGDYQHFFDEIGFRDNPEWQGCYCGETNLHPDARRGVAGTRAAMSEGIAGGGVTALLAYAGGGPVAWCNYGETTRLAGVMAKLGLDAAEHEGVGSVACFVISSQYRRHGLARRLLEVACERLRERGCTAVEAYPPKGTDSDYPNYRGPLAMYLEAGFEPYRDAGRTQIMRKSLV